MAAIDRVVHHSVILDMMEIESYRATEANHQRKLQQATVKAEAQKPATVIVAENQEPANLIVAGNSHRQV